MDIDPERDEFDDFVRTNDIRSKEMIIKPLEKNTFSKIVSLVNKGKLKDTLGNHLDTIAFYNQALDVYPKDENEYFGQKYLYELLANSFEKQGNLNETLRYLEKAYQCYEGSKDKDLLLKMSVIYNQMNNEELSKHYTNLCIEQGGRKLVEECMLLKRFLEEEVQNKNKTEVPYLNKDNISKSKQEPDILKDDQPRPKNRPPGTSFSLLNDED